MFDGVQNRVYADQGSIRICIWSREVLCEADWEKKGTVLLKCQPIALGVGHDLRLYHLVHLTLDVVCAIQHKTTTPAMTVHSTANYSTPAVSFVPFSNAGVGITLASAMPHPDRSITTEETKSGLISKISCSVMLPHQPVEPCITLLSIQNGPRYRSRSHSVNHLRRLRMVCMDTRGLWRPVFFFCTISFGGCFPPIR